MTADISIFGLFWHASFIVQLVMLTLLGMSIFSWAVIISRNKLISQAKAKAETFEDIFWSGVNLRKIYQALGARNEEFNGMEDIFYSGFSEFVRLNRSENATPDFVMDGAARAMRVSVSREVDDLEANLPFLATVGSISPYVGLFGTVWGIMQSFLAISAMKQATLAMVAPGIAEALIATAMGLVAAIPAIIFYNRLSSMVGEMEHKYVTFAEEFHTVLHRQAVAEKPSND